MPAGPPKSQARPLPPWLWGLLACDLAFTGWLCTNPATRPWTRAVEVVFLGLMQAASALVFWRASKREELPSGYRQASRWISVSWLLFIGADLVFPFNAGFQSGDVTLGLVDGFYLLSYPVLYFALTRLPKAEPPLPGLGRILLDGLAFLVGIGVPLWFFSLHLSVEKGPGLLAFLSAVYPLLALVGFMILNRVLLRTAPFPSRTALYLILSGIGVSWLADLVFGMEIAQSAMLGFKYWVNISNAISLALAVLGGWRLLTDPVTAKPLRPAIVSPVPMITIAFVSIVLVHLLFKGSMDGTEVRNALAGVLSLIVVLLFRETLAVRETTALAADAATAQLKARFEALVRHSSDLTLVLDADGIISFASPAAAKVSGLHAEAMHGRPLAEFLHPEDASPTAAFLMHLAGSFTTLPHHCRMSHRDGTWRVLDISGSNLLSDPTVQGLVLNARDITERHRLEDQLREAQKMEAVGRLAGGVAHDFNNLLSAILGNLELAELGLSPDHPAQRELNRIHGAATRGAFLTGRLLAFCRRDSPESKSIDPAQLIRDLAPLIEGLLGERIPLALDLAPDTWPITIDPNELEQAILNMAANARDAMPDGGRLGIRLRNRAQAGPEISPYLPIPGGDTVLLEVEDSGLGMDESTLQHLFEPFYTTKGRGKGTGLGLASVYGLVKASHGGLTVKSHPGQGTRIGLVFPRGTRPVEAADAPADQDALRGWETILLVEDEPSVREVTQRILAARGYTILDAADADAARQVFKAHPTEIHLLLTDVIMPGDSGPKLAAELVSARPGLRVLYMSGYTADELGPHGLARPDAPLLRKPFTAAQLTRRLRSVLAGPPGRV